MIRHPFAPVYDVNSRILILGSFPSVRSRDEGFFYGHPRNRFWQVTASVLGEEIPSDIPDKKAFLLRDHIALWDVIAECEIQASDDSSIRSAKPNDISPILDACRIKTIYTNGAKAHSLYTKHMLPLTGIDAVRLPSTSPANAAYSTARLIEEWSVILSGLK